MKIIIVLMVLSISSAFSAYAGPEKGKLGDLRRSHPSQGAGNSSATNSPPTDNHRTKGVSPPPADNEEAMRTGMGDNHNKDGFR